MPDQTARTERDDRSRTAAARVLSWRRPSSVGSWRAELRAQRRRPLRRPPPDRLARSVTSKGDSGENCRDNEWRRATNSDVGSPRGKRLLRTASARQSSGRAARAPAPERRRRGRPRRRPRCPETRKWHGWLNRSRMGLRAGAAAVRLQVLAGLQLLPGARRRRRPRAHLVPPRHPRRPRRRPAARAGPGRGRVRFHVTARAGHSSSRRRASRWPTRSPGC